MKKLRFKGEPGTVLKDKYDNGTVLFRVGTEKDVPDELADTLLRDFPRAFELVVAEPEPKRDKEPEKNRMRTSAPHKRGKGK